MRIMIEKPDNGVAHTSCVAWNESPLTVAVKGPSLQYFSVHHCAVCCKELGWWSRWFSDKAVGICVKSN